MVLTPKVKTFQIRYLSHQLDYNIYKKVSKVLNPKSYKSNAYYSLLGCYEHARLG